MGKHLIDYTHIIFVGVAEKINLKEGLQSVLRIGSAHNKGGPPNINIVQISHFSNPFLIETLVYMNL